MYMYLMDLGDFNGRRLYAGLMLHYRLQHYRGQLSLAIPLWVGAMSTSQRAVMPCGWGVNAGIVRE